MGGTYWYYYRLDGELEQHDPVEPSTTACPLLPGQQVNILEVPTLGQHDTGMDQWSRRLLDSTVFTLDPKAKYNSPRILLKQCFTQDFDMSLPIAHAQRPLVDFQTTCMQSTASTKTLQLSEQDLPNISQRPCTVASKVSFLMAIFQKLRGTRSAPCTSKNSDEKPLKPDKRKLSEAQQNEAPAHSETFADLLSSRLRAPVNTPDWPSVTAYTAPVAPWTADSSVEPPKTSQSSLRTASSSSHQPSAPEPILSTISRDEFNDRTANVLSEDRQMDQGSGSGFVPSTHGTVSNQSWYRPELAATGSHAASTNPAWISQEGTTRVEQNCLNAVQHAASSFILPIQSNVPVQTTSPNVYVPTTHREGLQRPVRPPSLLFSTREALSTYYASSSSIGGQLSPHYLSQPESPSVRDFEEAWESESTDQISGSNSTYGHPPLIDKPANSDLSGLLNIPHSPGSGFQGYSLPEPEHESALTLRKPASVIFSPKQELSSKNHLVQSWNDGMTHGPTTTLDELVDDLGYLGKMIV